MQTLIELKEPYLGRQTTRGLQPSTIRTEGYRLDHLLRWLDDQGVVTPRQLTPQYLIDYQSRLMTAGDNTKGSSEQKIIVAKKFLTFLHANRHTATDLSDHLIHLKLSKCKLPKDVIPHEQVRNFFDGIDITTPVGYRNRTMMELAYTSALRVGDLRTAQVDDLNLDLGVIRLNRKGQKEQAVPVGATAKRFLTTYLNVVRPGWKGAGGQSALFLNQYGRPYASIRNLYKVVRKELKKGGFPDGLGTHVFRRSSATAMVEADANIFDLKEILCHTSLNAMTPYLKANPKKLKETLRRCHPREQDELRGL